MVLYVIFMYAITAKPKEEQGIKTTAFLVSKQPTHQKDYLSLKQYLTKEIERIYGNEVVFSQFNEKETISQIKELMSQDFEFSSELPVFKDSPRNSINDLTFIYSTRVLNKGSSKEMEKTIKNSFLGSYLVFEKENKESWYNL